MASLASEFKIKRRRDVLPGLNAPLNWIPSDKYSWDHNKKDKALFPTALDTEFGDCRWPLTTLREFTMLQLMNHLTDKPNWEDKIFDQDIVAKWRLEVLAMEGRDVSPRMLDWVIDELRYKSKIFKETGAVSIYNGDVVKSDSAIPQILREDLKAAVRPLEEVPEIHVDYHPGSNGTVIDLVHPSLFPLIYGRSRVLEDKTIGLDDCIKMIGKGTSIPVPLEEQERSTRSEYLYELRRHISPEYSRNFQWLPCEVDISATDESVKITSYVNNLHPRKHRELYTVLEQIVSRVIPLWNMTLSPLADKSTRPRRIKYDNVQYDPNPNDLPNEERPQQGEDEGEDDFWERSEEWLEQYREEHLVLPEPLNFSHWAEYLDSQAKKGVNLRQLYGVEGLQVIVKLANIRLTPETPSYEGGTWHVEGQLNEHICASAIYYYDSDNITESRLAFRQRGDEEVGMDVGYEQNDHHWAEEVFGVVNEEPTVQDVGDVICKEGRLITFPNILQHRVRPFKLADPSKSGHRKILALFLVDPNMTIISTAHVPPQQREWWSEKVVATSSLNRLPQELLDKLFHDVDDFPIGLTEAKEIREKLMKERDKFVVSQTDGFKETYFSLCEH